MYITLNTEYRWLFTVSSMKCLRLNTSALPCYRRLGPQRRSCSATSCSSLASGGYRCSQPVWQEPSRRALSILYPSSYRGSQRSIIVTSASSSSPSSESGDKVLRTISDNGQVSVIVATGTRLVQEACERHKTAPTASAALGRALMGTLLMATFRGEGEKCQVTFRGDGPLGSMQIIADASGNVKGKVSNPNADPPLRADGKLNVGGAVGRGILAVVRSLPFTEKGWQKPYTGMVPIVSGEVAEDLNHYLLESEQTQSAVGLGVSITRDLEIDAAGGFLVQCLPFVEEETVSQLEQNIANMGPLSTLIREGATARDLTEKLLHGLGSSDAGFGLTPSFGPCEPSELRERMASAVAALGREEVQSILEEQGKVEVTCEFCKDTYHFYEEEIMKMVESAENL